MKREQVAKTALFLRLALAFVFGYAAVRSYLHPNDWIGYVPEWVKNFGFTRSRILLANSIVELAVALALLADFLTRFVALISFFLLVAIVIVSGFGLLDVTFRDVGLALAALALFFL